MDISEIKLKPQHLKFANEILRGKSQREAYIAAGYKAKNEKTMDSCASEILTNPKVKKYLEIQKEKLQQFVEKKTEISREWVLNKYREVAERCNQDVVPATDRKGQPIFVEDKEGKLCQAFIFNAKGVVSALDGIARVQGYNAPDKHEHSGLIVVKQVEELSVPELIALAKLRKN